MFIFLSAKPRPSKKARLNKPADEDVAVEPEKTPDPEETNIDAILNDPPPQDHDFVAEQAEVDTTSHADQPTSPIRTDNKPASPVKNTDKPPTPVTAADDKDDDIMITGTATPLLATLSLCQSMLPRTTSLLSAKANGMPIYQSSPTSMLKIFILAS